jgi:hypothetical protein
VLIRSTLCPPQIAEKQRLREEEVLTQKRRSERRSQLVWQSGASFPPPICSRGNHEKLNSFSLSPVGYSIVLLVVIFGVLLARWTIREARVAKRHSHKGGDL